MMIPESRGARGSTEWPRPGSDRRPPDVVPSTNGSSKEPDTLPALSVATRWTVCGPSAVPSSGSAVVKLKFPAESNGTREGRTGVDLAPTSDATPLKASVTLPLTVGVGVRCRPRAPGWCR